MQLYSGSKMPIFLLVRLPPFVGTKNAILLSVQPAVSAALLGRVLVVEGVEKAERNVLPVLNNLLENREMQLEDGRFILSADRYDKLLKVCRVVIFIILQQIPGGHSWNHLVRIIYLCNASLLLQELNLVVLNTYEENITTHHGLLNLAQQESVECKRACCVGYIVFMICESAVDNVLC